MNDVARLFLETYARGGEPDGGWKFGKALQQARLDFSHESLERVDLLLKAIRERAKPVHDEFLADPAGRNFCALLACYLMAVLSRRTGAQIDWHDTASARKAVSEWASITDGPFTRIVASAPDQGLLFLPLVWVHDHLFGLGLGQAPTAAEYLDGVTAELEADCPMSWWKAAREAGFAAASLMAIVAKGSRPMPLFAWQHARGQRHGLALTYDGADVVAYGEAALEHNRENAAWKTFAYDAFAGSAGARADAIAVTAQVYGQAPLLLKLAFRYRTSGQGRPFAILEPLAFEFNISPDQLALLHTAIRKGVQSFAWPFAKSWDEYCEGRQDAASLLRATATPPSTYATGEMVRVGDAVLTDGGLWPARIVELVRGLDGRAACVFDDGRGARRTITADRVRDGLLFVARNPPDHDAACIAWLERRVQRSLGDRSSSRSAALAAAHARFALGSLLWQGIGRPRNQASARQYWQAAADAGFSPAELSLARMHLEGDTVPADTARGMDLLRRSAEKGYAPALARLGCELETGERVPADLDQAVTLLTRAVAAGDATAMHRLAWLHRVGKGVPLDVARSMTLLAESAEGDCADAQHELALCCGRGDGVPQDDARGVYWSRRAVRHGHAEAMNHLAGKYELGRGVPQDLEQAVALYAQAADKQVVAAWYHLGVMAADGRGMARDLGEAMRRMTFAAKNHHPGAQESIEDFELAATREGQAAMACRASTSPWRTT